MWVVVLVLKFGSVVIIVIIMGEYFIRVFIGVEVEMIDFWFNKMVVLVGLSLVIFLNCVLMRLGMRLNDMFMFLKFVVLIIVIIIGVVVVIIGYLVLGIIVNVEWKECGWFEGILMEMLVWVVVLYVGFWVYDGWDNVSFFFFVLFIFS